MPTRRHFIVQITAASVALTGGAIAEIGRPSDPTGKRSPGAAAVPSTGGLSDADRLSPRRVPAWARTARFRYARWDGGILEAAKGFLSGWPAWREPDQLLAVANWYEPRNIELIEMGHLNWIWVTFSNGFSLESERPHQERLRVFITACQHRGIHVTAYLSLMNMFPDDMFVREPRSKDWLARDPQGKPIPYGAANYAGFTSVTRYLACLLHPEWRAYLKRRVERVIEAGGEGVMWDNAMPVRCHCGRCEAQYADWRARTGAPDEAAAWTAYHRETLGSLVAELHAHAQRFRPEFLMYVNCNRGLYCLNRAGNGVTTEDGTEPGLNSEGKVVSNIGSLRYQWAVGEGWRPVRMEYGGRLRKGPFESRFTIPMTPRAHQLAIAEAAAHHVGFELFSLGRLQRDLFLREPAALANLRAAGRYNTFLERHAGLYEQPRSLARVALLANDDDHQAPASRELAERGQIFDVVFTATFTAEQLGHYHALVAPDVHYLSEAQLDLLVRHVEHGGRLVVSGQFGACDEHLRRRERLPTSVWFGLKEGQFPETGATVTRKTGSIVYGGQAMNWDVLTSLLVAWDTDPLVRVLGPRTVRFNLHGQHASSRWLLHLLNYAPEPARNLDVSLSVAPAKVTLLTPDPLPAGRVNCEVVEDHTRFVLPMLDIYAVVLIQPRGWANIKREIKSGYCARR